MKNNRVIPLTVVSALVIVGAVVWSYQEKAKREMTVDETPSSAYVTHRDRATGFNFTYKDNWGSVDQVSGNTTCPTEDTYRTADTLSVFDSEYTFDQMRLSQSDSFIRSGIRLYTLDPKKLNDCGDEFLLMLARGEFDGEALSSIKLERIETTNFIGYRNKNASRLNTEYRSQYLLFPKNYSWGEVLIIQPYLSYTPNSETKDLAEMEQKFDGDINSYITTGKSAEEIRKRLAEFEKMIETISPSKI